jgi:glucose/arabinose dehydrogenase
MWFAAAFIFAFAAVSSAATLPPGFTETLVAGGLRRPTAMALAPDGRVFVAEQAGALRVIKDGALLPAPFVTLTVSSSGERGLLGVTVDPDFETNGFVYVYYTATMPVIHNRVSRFTAAGDIAAPGSELVLMDLDPLSGATNHNGGAIHFGPDGTLFVAVGENANRSNSQTLNNRLGKVLRINADGTIPEDNPFYTVAAGENRSIWALGLRNPFTFAFQPISGTMFINDVGELTWEEINVGTAGANYGWPETEGPTNDPRFDAPLHAYTHSGGACAISGGAFYNPAAEAFPANFVGTYFFADFCGGWIRGRSPSTGAIAPLATGITNPVDLRVADDGSLYYLARGGGSTTGVVYRIQYDGPRVDLTANGADGPVQLDPQAPLAIALTVDAGGEAAIEPAELYLAIATPSGALWWDPASRRFVPAVTRTYAGPLPAFGPVALFNFPQASLLAPGPYWWIAVVDNDLNGTPDFDLFDVVLTVVP